MTGLIIRYIQRRTATFPTLIERNKIPQNGKEVPSQEGVRAHPHLRCMADKIHPLDESAKIQLLIGRDAPKPLKVQAFTNGPIGAPWAQTLVLGWTISSLTCLDLVDGPIDVETKRTSITTSKHSETLPSAPQPQPKALTETAHT